MIGSVLTAGVLYGAFYDDALVSAWTDDDYQHFVDGGSVFI